MNVKMRFDYIGRMGGAWVMKTVGLGERRRFESIGTLPWEVEKHGAE